MNTTPDIATIRRATVEDAAAMAELSASTFVETFGHLYPPEDLTFFLGKNHSADSWTRKLSDPARAVWIAEHRSGRNIGFIVVGACTLPVQNMEGTAGEVQQLYVLAEYHSLRLGTKLMDTGLEWLQTQGRVPMYVGVWSENHNAQRFYARYGFNKVGEYGYPVGNTVDHEFIMKR